LSRHKNKGTVLTELQKQEAKNTITQKYKFQLGWFPPQWLVWFCYGPPLALGEAPFSKRQMEHLVQVQAAPLPQNFELDIMTLGRNSKNVRRSDESRVSDKDGEVEQDNTMTNKTVTIVREEKKKCSK